MSDGYKPVWESIDLGSGAGLVCQVGCYWISLLKGVG